MRKLLFDIHENNGKEEHALNPTIQNRKLNINAVKDKCSPWGKQFQNWI